MSPRKRASAAATLASSTSAAPRSVTWPSASPVSVAAPRRTSATYSLAASRPCCANLVASPNSSGSSPEASGSSVPAWPAFSAPSRRFTACRTALELGPTGLSSSRTPSSLRRIGRRPLALGRDDAVDQARETVAALDRRVVDEAQFGRRVHLHAVRELRAQEARRALQRPRGVVL